LSVENEEVQFSRKKVKKKKKKKRKRARDIKIMSSKKTTTQLTEMLSL
jgi:hypothetical protein